MFSLLVVLVKLSVLAKWLTRKTPLRMPNRGKIISTRLKSAYDFFGLVYCFIVLLCFSGLPALHDIFHIPMARYSQFVLTVLLNTINHSTIKYSHTGKFWTRYRSRLCPSLKRIPFRRIELTENWNTNLQQTCEERPFEVTRTQENLQTIKTLPKNLAKEPLLPDFRASRFSPSCLSAPLPIWLCPHIIHDQPLDSSVACQFLRLRYWHSQ